MFPNLLHQGTSFMDDIMFDVRFCVSFLKGFGHNLWILLILQPMFKGSLNAVAPQNKRLINTIFPRILIAMRRRELPG